jgi:hypothetical protein
MSRLNLASKWNALATFRSNPKSINPHIAMTSPHKSKLSLLLALCIPWAASLQAAPVTETIISDGSTPEVAYSLSSESDPLEFRVRVQALQVDFPQPEVVVGIHAQETKWLRSASAQAQRDGEDWIFTLPLEFDLDQTERWRWAMEVSWPNQAGAQAVRQNFFVPSEWAAFRPLGNDPAEWDSFSLNDYRTQQTLKNQQLKITFEQPIEGKASIVIEDAKGHRVRNLVMGRALSRGTHEFLWDGLDEQGDLVTPGTYQWRAISHPGIDPELQMWFYNPGKDPWSNGQDAAWLGDHSNPIAAASNGQELAFGSPVAESGHNIVVLNEDGSKRSHAHLSWFVGNGDLFLALGPDHLYALSEGTPNYGHTKKGDDGQDYVRGELVLLRWDLDGRRLNYSGKQGEALIREYTKPAAEVTQYHKGFQIGNIRGVVWLNEQLFVSLHNENIIAVIDPKTGKQTASIPVDAPGPLASDGKCLYVLNEAGQVTRIDSPSSNPSAAPLFEVQLSAPLLSKNRYDAPWPVASALAVDTPGRLLVADNGQDQNIKVYSLDSGSLTGELGPRGGRASRGHFDPNTLQMPYSMAFDGKGMLWVAENEGTPRRISQWDVDAEVCTQQLLGPTSYGAPGAGFDPLDASRWIAADMLWDVNIATGDASLKSVLHHQEQAGQLAGPPPGGLNDVPAGLDVQIVHVGDRTFYFTKGRFLKVFELLPDDSARLWAVIGTLNSFQASTPRWTVPEVFTRHPLLKDELRDFTEVTGPFGGLRNNSKASPNASNYMILWTDLNGDEIAQVDELQVSADSRQLIISFWSCLNFSLDLSFAMKDGSNWLRTALPLHGFLPSGAPDWRLTDSFSNAVPISGYEPKTLQATMVDSQDRLLMNASPMGAVDTDGNLLWQMKNDWVGVHGSQRAPLPQVGQLQGALSFLGRASFDDEGDLTVLNGNHGRYFVLTTDGIYIDEIFEDVRVALTNNPKRIGGEPFGGFFGRDPDTGEYLLQSGHRAFQIYKLEGLQQLQRSHGSIEVSADQVTAAQKLMEVEQVKPALLGTAQIAQVDAQVDLAASPDDWPMKWTAEWGDTNRAFPYARAKAVIQGDRLHLAYQVKDPSPWLNLGTDANMLFKTGDAVDYKFAVNQEGSPTRVGPIEGDRRLLIANHQGKTIAVLYDYVVPGTENPVYFNSPWRSAKVDRVSILKNAVIEVTKSKNGYSVHASIPLSEIGLNHLDTAAALRADFGVIYSDQEGRSNILRSYWANPATGLVNDVPGETLINPSLWSELRLNP